MGDAIRVRRALLSVSDKSGLLELAAALARHGVTLLSTGGTARTLRDAGLDVIDVSEATGFPEMMDGRVKTLHPVVHGGLLGRTGVDEAVMAEHGIAPIDLLVLNLYPFEQVSADPDAIVVIGFEESSRIVTTMIEQGVGPGDKGVYGVDGNMGNALGESFEAGE